MWVRTITFDHLFLIRRGWREVNFFWDRERGDLWIKMVP